MSQKKGRKGFTLIELMIVVAIIGILAAVAIPKFADLVTKSKESAAKATLGAVRSALSIYYSDLEGLYPSNLFRGLATGSKYMPTVAGAAALGKFDIPKHAQGTGNVGHGFGVIEVADVSQGAAVADNFAFHYSSGTGDTEIGCTHVDTKSCIWSTY